MKPTYPGNDIGYGKYTTDILTRFTNLSDTEIGVNVLHDKYSIKSCCFGMKEI